MDLSQAIKKYYFDHIGELPEDKRFHFASRIAAWEGDADAIKLLGDLRSFMVPSSPAEMDVLLDRLLGTPLSPRINARVIRTPFFEKYPRLYGVHNALFRVRHLKSVYGVDAKPAFLEKVGQVNLDRLSENLAHDDEAVRILSTFAVNFFFLYKFILMGQKDFLDLDNIIRIASGYDMRNKKHTQLLIYLFTHCIIGETNFYTQTIDPGRLNKFTRMLGILEAVISDNYDLINLDNKLEFLVACRICDYSSNLFEEIYRECDESLSHEGHFLIDQHNKNAQEDRKSFERSEHRNVLYIMSRTSYSPHSTLV
jgi:hypothetical protein